VQDGNPAEFNDEVWIDSFYTLDGKKIAGLSHTEYHGWSFKGECHSQNYNECEYDSDTFHISYDGGYHFEGFKAPANFVAGFLLNIELTAAPWAIASTPTSWNGAVVLRDGHGQQLASELLGQTGPSRCLVQGVGHPFARRMFSTLRHGEDGTARIFQWSSSILPRPGRASRRACVHARAVYGRCDRNLYLSAGKCRRRGTVGLL